MFVIGVTLGVSQVFAIVVATVHVHIKRCSTLSSSIPRWDLRLLWCSAGGPGARRPQHSDAPSTCSRLFGVLMDKGQHGHNKVMFVL